MSSIEKPITRQYTTSYVYDDGDKATAPVLAPYLHRKINCFLIMRVLVLVISILIASNCIVSNGIVLAGESLIDNNLYHHSTNYIRNILSVNKVIPGDVLPLHSYIEMPPRGTDVNAKLVLQFARSDLDEDFVNDLFYKKDKNTLHNHLFNRNGIRSVLTDDHLLLTILPGVRLHLRNDIENNDNYKTFINDSVIAKVLIVKGNVLVSTNSEIIKNKLKGLYVDWHEKRAIQDDISRGTINFQFTNDDEHQPKVIETDLELSE